MVFFTCEQRIVYVCEICYARYPTKGQAEDCQALGETKFKFEEGQKVKLLKLMFDDTKEKSGTKLEEIEAEVMARIIGNKHHPRYLLKLRTGETVDASESFLVPA